jgi:signal peptidase I
MTEFSGGISASISTGAAANPLPKPWKWKAAIGLWLGLMAPGMGHIYVRRPWRGLAIAACTAALDFILVKFRLHLTFIGLITIVLLAVFWRSYFAGEAFCIARKNRQTNETNKYSTLLLTSTAVIILLLTVYPVPQYWEAQMRRYFGAFKIPSRSMCPTLCEGDRLVADRTAYKLRAPQRGELILFKSRDETLYTKRVIAVGGDIVEPGTGDEILVNGKPIQMPKVCGQPNTEKDSEQEAVHFDPVKVPGGQLFVIGDNLHNSFDSRFPDFGFPSLDQVRAKPLYLYWSTNHSRIGCGLR